MKKKTIHYPVVYMFKHVSFHVDVAEINCLESTQTNPSLNLNSYTVC